MEIFKDIPNYIGIYQASNLGRIKSLKFGKERILKGGLGGDGYYNVVLSNNKNKKTYKVHQLVAISFLNHTPCGYELVVNHKNFIKTDNRVQNLEIVTARENCNKKHLKSSSQYVGIFWDNTANKWRANIFINGKNKHLGCFITEKEASLYYENAVKNYELGLPIEVKKKEYTSKYTGVCWHKRANKWMASIKINGKTKYLGTFQTELEASQAYQKELQTIK